MEIKRGSREELFSDYLKKLYTEDVSKVEYKRLGLKTTVCLVTTRNGFEVVGKSACVNPLDYNEGLGKIYALEDALNSLGGFIGFLRQEQEFRGE
jgi:hypothetical protein